MRGLTEDEARRRPTISALTLGGLLKHVTLNEQGWIRTVTDADPEAEFDMESASSAYELTDDETFEQWLAEFCAQAERTNAFIREVPDLDVMIPLPTAPWAPEGEHQSVRRILLQCSGRPPTTAGTPTSSARSSTGATPRCRWRRTSGSPGSEHAGGPG